MVVLVDVLVSLREVGCGHGAAALVGSFALVNGVYCIGTIFSSSPG